MIYGERVFMAHVSLLEPETNFQLIHFYILILHPANLPNLIIFSYLGENLWVTHMDDHIIH